jgi:hypothetical protein
MNLFKIVKKSAWVIAIVLVISSASLGCKSTKTSSTIPKTDKHWIAVGEKGNPHDFSYYAERYFEGVVFYNLENLFDTIDGPNDDAEFLPSGDYKWGSERYQQKLQNMSTVLDSIQNRIGYGLAPKNNRPHLTLMGFVELENRLVLEDLLTTWKSKDEAGNATAVQTSNYRTGKQRFDYQIIHRESPDKRGIDVALVYDTLAWDVLKVDMIPVPIPGNFPTRDIMAAYLFHRSTHDTFLVAVNHWPSRRGGAESAENRAIAARALKSYCNQPFIPKRIIIMGDFNDDPSDPSIATVLGAQGLSDFSEAEGSNSIATLFNPAKTYRDSGWIKGSLAYRPYSKPGVKELPPVQWNQFDQIIISKTLLESSLQQHPLYVAMPLKNINVPQITLEQRQAAAQLRSKPVAFGVMAPHWMRQHEEPYMDFPLRTFGGKKFLNGYSDHFPVYLLLNFLPPQ